MKRRSILDILNAAETPEGRFLSLHDVEFLRDEKKKLIFFIGNGAVTFRVLYSRQAYALRLYLTPHPRLRKIYDRDYYCGEFNIGTRSDFSYIDLVLMPWIEGCTLEQRLKQALDAEDVLSLWKLSRTFDAMALRLLEGEGAHGDLSPSNIIVCPDGEMCCIDKDASFHPDFEGEQAHELGTPAYQSRLRRANLFSSRMDDFSIALLSVNLAALTLSPTLAQEYSDEDSILLNGQCVGSKGYAPLQRVKELFLEEGDFAHYTLAHLLSLNLLSMPTLPSLLRFILQRPEPSSHLESFEELGRWGYVDCSTGEIAIAPMFDMACSFDDGVALVRLAGKQFWIDSSGRLVF